MTGSNLPPGVEDYMIPGNRSEDIELEQFHALVDKMLGESIGEQRAEHFFKYIEAGDWEEVLMEYVDIAAGVSAAKALIEDTIIRSIERGEDETNDL